MNGNIIQGLGTKIIDIFVGIRIAMIFWEVNSVLLKHMLWFYALQMSSSNVFFYRCEEILLNIYFSDKVYIKQYDIWINSGLEIIRIYIIRYDRLK